MLNAIPVFGWMLDFFFKASLAVPFWIIWTGFGVGETYAYWLPPVYQHPGFWSCVGIFICMGIIHTIFVPKFVSSSSSSEVKKDK